ncbi:MAG: hypothetical protein ACLFU4_09275 [Opitutales bacterium]
MQEHRALILRSNRFLGSSLVDKGLISVGDLEAANEVFMGAIQSDDFERASILNTLLFHLKALEETALLDHLVEESNFGLVDLDFVTLPSLRSLDVDVSLCWASSTIPFDKVEGTYMVATCYYFSAPVLKHWENLLEGPIIWYATSTASMTRALERARDMDQAEAEAAQAEADDA